MGLSVHGGRAAFNGIARAESTAAAAAAALAGMQDASVRSAINSRQPTNANAQLAALAASLAPPPEQGSSSCSASSTLEGADRKGQQQAQQQPSIVGRPSMQQTATHTHPALADAGNDGPLTGRADNVSEHSHEHDEQPLPLPPAPINSFLGLPNISLPDSTHQQSAASTGLAAGQLGSGNMQDAFAAFARSSWDGQAAAAMPGESECLKHTVANHIHHLSCKNGALSTFFFSSLPFVVQRIIAACQL